MSTLTRIKPSAYHDSVTLMLVAQAVLKLPGVQDAAVVMGTPANREIIAAAGLLTHEAAGARPDDLLIVIKAEDEASAVAALAQAEEILAAKAPRAEPGAAHRPKSLASAIAAAPDANLAVISVAGRYAAGEARTALENGLHVLLFSDNVSLEEEIALKKLAAERGLLCMGPDAGTAIINGVALGVRQRGAAGQRGAGQRGGHRPAGGHVRAGARRRGGLAGHRHGRSRSERGGRRRDDARRAGGAAGGSGHGRDRAHLQAAGRRRSRDGCWPRSIDSGQAHRRLLPRRRAGAHRGRGRDPGDEPDAGGRCRRRCRDRDRDRRQLVRRAGPAGGGQHRADRPGCGRAGEAGPRPVRAARAVRRRHLLL